MAGVKASLQSIPDLQVTSVDESVPDALQRFDELHPDVIIFDLTNGQPACALQVVKKYPALTLIGIDPSQDHLLVLSSRQHQVLTMDALTQAIQTPLGLPIAPSRSEKPVLSTVSSTSKKIRDPNSDFQTKEKEP